MKTISGSFCICINYNSTSIFIIKQASFGEENNSLEKFKALQKKHLQLKGILKEKESSISRLTKIIKDQVL